MQDSSSELPYVAKEDYRVRRSEQAGTETQRATSTRRERAIICALCQHRITSEQDRIQVSGSHEHQLFNPHGILFHIGCFQTARGCTVAGDATTEFSWFPGFAWRHALCGGCQQHLGWRFENDSGYTFFSLVLNRLIAGDSHEH